MPTGRRRGSARAGFLLVEALATLAIAALLIGSLLVLTGMLRKSADRAAFRVETMEVGNRLVWTIAREIREATRARWAPQQRDPSAATPTAQAQATQRPDGSDGRAPSPSPDQPEGGGGTGAEDAGGQQGPKPPDRDFVFSGTPDKILFALAPEQATGLRAPVMVVYQIDASGAALRAEGAIRPDAKGADAVRLGPVARVEPGPERLRFAYVAIEPNGDEVITDAWTETRRMPAAVRIDRLDPATGAPLGSLRVPILLSGEPGCVNPDRGFCSRVDRSRQGGATRQGRPAAGQPNASGEPE